MKWIDGNHSLEFNRTRRPESQALCCRDKQEKRNSHLTLFQESDFSVLLCIIVGIGRIGKILVSDCSQGYAEFGNTNIFSVICIV